VGQPNHALAPLPRSAELSAGLAMSGATNQVKKMFQPPLSTVSWDARRVISVPQSIAASSALTPIFLSASMTTSAWALTIGWSVAVITTTFRPS